MTYTTDELREMLERDDCKIMARLQFRPVVEELIAAREEIRKLKLKCSNSLANNLCPDHRDKQRGKSCLACEIERLKGAKP